jgi:hypothetical protein
MRIGFEGKTSARAMLGSTSGRTSEPASAALKRRRERFSNGIMVVFPCLVIGYGAPLGMALMLRGFQKP